MRLAGNLSRLKIRVICHLKMIEYRLEQESDLQFFLTTTRKLTKTLHWSLIMKHYITKIALLSAGLGLGLPCVKAAPFMAVGDNAELFVTGAATLQSDNNIYLDSSNEKSDTIYSFTPGADLVFGKGSITTGNVYFREEIRRYSSNSNQDVSLANVGAKSSYDNGVTKAGFNASYAELAQNDNDIRVAGDIVHRNLTNVAANLEFGFSEKTSLGTGITFDRTDYGPSSYSDSNIWSLPVDVYFKASPKLDWSVGYRYRSSQLSGSGIDSTDHFLNLGARGEFSPKLTGQVRFGYTRRSLDVGGDENLFGVDGNLNYAFSEKTSCAFNIGNDFGSSGTGDSTKNFSLGLNVSNQMSEQWSFTGGLSYRKIDYSTRSDDYVEGLVSVSYSLNAMVNFGASYTYRNNTSDLSSAEFTNSVFSLGANIRY